MPGYAFVQQADGSLVGPGASVSTSAPIINTAGNLLLAVGLFVDAALASSPVTDTQGDVFSNIVTFDDAGSTNNALRIYGAIAKGGSNIYTLTAAASAVALYVAEFSAAGASFALNAVGSIKTSNSVVGANNIATALLGNSGDDLLFSFALNTNKHAANSAGTSPVAFTARAPVWTTYGGGTLCGISEDAEVLANSAATWGTVAGGVFDPIIVVAAAFSLLPPAAGSGLSGAGVSRSSGLSGAGLGGAGLSRSANL